MWQRVAGRDRTVGGDKLDRLVKKLMRQRHQLKVRRQYVVTVPFHRGARTKERIKALLVWGLALRRVPPEWICEIRRRIRVVFSQRPSVGKQLDNHRKFAAAFTLAEPFPCVCRDHPIRDVWRGDRPKSEHVQYLLSECDDPVLRRVSAVGSAYIPVPQATLSAQEVVAAADEFGAGVLTGDSAFCDGWGSEGRRRVRDIVQVAMAGIDPARGWLVTSQDVKYTQRAIAGLVVGPVDRNIKDRLIECPAVYWRGYRDTFWTANYDREKDEPGAGMETEDQILQRWLDGGRCMMRLLVVGGPAMLPSSHQHAKLSRVLPTPW